MWLEIQALQGKNQEIGTMHMTLERDL
jgi:hypothetical protein